METGIMEFTSTVYRVDVSRMCCICRNWHIRSLFFLHQFPLHGPLPWLSRRRRRLDTADFVN